MEAPALAGASTLWDLCMEADGPSPVGQSVGTGGRRLLDGFETGPFCREPHQQVEVTAPGELGCPGGQGEDKAHRLVPEGIAPEPQAEDTQGFAQGAAVVEPPPGGVGHHFRVLVGKVGPGLDVLVGKDRTDDSRIFNFLQHHGGFSFQVNRKKDTAIP